MGCGCGGGVASRQTYERKNMVSDPSECNITKSDIQSWLTVLNCMKTSERFDKADISEKEVNIFIGIMQSALNYPDNYCIYKVHLDYFKDNHLPKLLLNVPECIS